MRQTSPMQQLALGAAEGHFLSSWGLIVFAGIPEGEGGDQGQAGAGPEDDHAAEEPQNDRE